MSIDAAAKKSGLARYLNLPDGLSMAEAGARVELHLEMLRDRAEAEMQAAVEALGRLMDSVGPTPGDHIRGEMLQLASGVTSLGGTFGREALSKAGYGLCSLLDELGERWDPAAVQLHVNAIRVLFAAGPGAAEAHADLLEGLQKVRARVLAPPPVHAG